MNDVATLIVLTLMAGLAMPAGAVLGRVDSIHPNWLNSETRHGVVAFGGGALLSAIALVLVPEGIEVVSPPVAAACFLSGGLLFLAIDVFLDRHKSPGGQLVAMLSDFIPEAIALGASFASGNSTAMLLAILIAIQNLPEGFNAYRELTVKARVPGRRVLTAFFVMALLGPCAGLSGYYVFAQHEMFVASMMLFAGGGILYLVFQDIAPEARLQRRWMPAIGAVLGFLIGLIGKMLV
ncbi:MAG TPA: divalent cation transporter [Planctomycetaceae bacterium]|nr:divalent cation transporter [Planctomycetaceae bacterium]